MILKNNKKVECENYMFIKDSLEETIIENESFFWHTDRFK